MSSQEDVMEVMRARFGERSEQAYIAVDFECTHRHRVEDNWVWFGYVVYRLDETAEEDGIVVLERGDFARPIAEWGEGCAAFWATQEEALRALKARCPASETNEDGEPLETRHASNVRLGHVLADLFDKYEALLVTDIQAFDPVIVHQCLDVAGRRSLRYGAEGAWRGSGAILDTGEMARMLTFAGRLAPSMPEHVCNDHNPVNDAYAIAVHHGALCEAARNYAATYF
jgi:hypothetical protein